MSFDLKFTEEEAEKLKNQIPYTVKVRRMRLDSIVQELNRRNFKTLDETDKEDFSRVESIISDLFPDTSSRKIIEYARVSIRLWNKEKK